MKELKLKLKKIWSNVSWKAYKSIKGKMCDMFLILDLRGNEQVDPLSVLLESEQFNDLINKHDYVTVQWKSSYFAIDIEYNDDDSFNFTYGEELSTIRAHLLGLYSRIDRALQK